MNMDIQDHPPAQAPLPQEIGGDWCCAWTDQGQLLAALHRQPALGLSRARCSFHLGRVVHAAPELGLHQVQTTLQLGHDATGSAEFSGLWLAPASVGQGVSAQVLDALLAHALAEFNSTAERVVVELPGWRDAGGRSPFWDGLVRHFLPDNSPPEAALKACFGPALSTHLGAMLPRQLIHAAFLPPQAQQVLGRCDDAYAPWYDALVRAGFSDWQHCRLEDGGPLLARPLRQR